MRISVEMSFPRVIFTGKERKGGFPLNSSFNFSVDDDKCPFCGQQLHDAKCSCKKFNIALSRALKKIFGDVIFSLDWAQVSPNANIPAVVVGLPKRSAVSIMTFGTVIFK